MRILLVEDEPDAARMIAKGLREQSYAVDVVGDGEAACYQAAVNDYDAIVLDVLLPLKDGLAGLPPAPRRGLVRAHPDADRPRRRGGAHRGPRQRGRRLPDQALRLRRAAGAFARPVRRSARPLLPERVRVADLELDTRAHRVTKRGGRWR